jgi:predicted nucleotide-binding protein
VAHPWCDHITAEAQPAASSQLNSGVRRPQAPKSDTARKYPQTMVKKTEPAPPAQPKLTIPREEVEARLQDRIKRGEELRDRQIGSLVDLDAARAEHDRWSAFNAELLKRLFTTQELAEEYSRFYGSVTRMNPTPTERVQRFRENVSDGVNRLKSIRERLELFDIAATSESSAPAKAEREGPRSRVFIVHGHDEAAKETVARFLEKLDLQAVILHEQASRGRTVIEKLEGYSDVDFAVVLLTPDDLGAAKDEIAKPKPRARQNVVLELGYFIGLLGREQVCALHKGGLELPSDFGGVVYVSMDDGGWRLLLARELLAAGFRIDMNRAV